MTLPIEGVRPAPLPPELRRDIHELRSFRHIFRNIYDSVLDPARVEGVNDRVPRIMETMSASHRSFLKDLHRIARAL